jgi:DNA-binding MarR family transcriptional regulator
MSIPNDMATANQPDPALRPAVERALEAFEELQQQLMGVHAPEFAALDITMAQAKLLYVIAAAPGSSMSEIAHRLGVAISTASGAVDHLVSLGLLDRFDDPANRRQVRVSVTPHGLETLEGMRELGTHQLRVMIERVDDDDLAVVEQAIRIMTASITTDTASTTGSHE